jgi:hypothetical protein
MNCSKRTFVPIELKQANRFISMYHGHNGPVKRAKFQIGLMEGEELIGVAVAGRPVARLLGGRLTIEILRTCVKPDHPDANSQLYGRMRQICERMGYTKIITYTLKREHASGLLAVGARPVAETKPQTWDRATRHRRTQPVYSEPKIRWELNPTLEAEEKK